MLAHSQDRGFGDHGYDIVLQAASKDQGVELTHEPGINTPTSNKHVTTHENSCKNTSELITNTDEKIDYT